MKGHVALDELGGAEVQGRRRPAFDVPRADHRQDRCSPPTNGRFYTLAADKLPGGRGFGEPVRLMVDIEGEARSSLCMVAPARRTKLLVASSDGRGFVTPRRGDPRRDPQGQADGQSAPRREARGRAADGAGGDDMSRRSARTASWSSSRWPSCPKWRAGQGVQLQRYRDGGLSDAIAFRFRRRSELGDGRRKRPRAHRERPDSVARRARRRRADAAAGIPQDQPVSVKSQVRGTD